MNVIMNLQVPYNAGNVACLLPGRAKDLSALLYRKEQADSICSFYTRSVRQFSII